MSASLVAWARPLLTQALEDGNFEALVDPRLGFRYNSSEMASMVGCAAACVHPFILDPTTNEPDCSCFGRRDVCTGSLWFFNKFKFQNLPLQGEHEEFQHGKGQCAGWHQWEHWNHQRVWSEPI
ncbi:hypothetical protein OIU76_008870 [Salix suchowensis]|nr:hypothetical protein OIU76_008870 [Salix suchowensis]